MPVDVVIDLGRSETLCGFKYSPDRGMWGPGILTRYEFFVSADGTEWKRVDQGEFANIKNNPVPQLKTFAPELARYIKLRALRNTEGNSNVGYAEVDVITN
jgi:alpha-L-fucosidase